MNYTLGLDIGITSVGSASINLDTIKLIEMAVRRFNEAHEAKDARLNRSARRTLRRKKWRKEQLLDAFDDFKIISKEEIKKVGKENYLSFYGKGEGLIIPNTYTIYHLRQKALKEQISKREILLCLYNILQARGHFLLDTIDFSKDGLTFNVFKTKFYETAEKYVDFINDRKIFEESYLKKTYDGSIGINDLKTKIKKERFALDDDSDTNLQALCTIVAGGKAKIGNLYNNEDESTLNVDDLKKKDEPNELQIALVELYDICRISRILKDGKQYVCDIAVDNINKFEVIKRTHNEDGEDYKEFKNASKKRVRAYKNLNNSYPNGLYVKEISAILHNQQQYYPEISDEFIEVCSSIASARIPYYIGPLGEYAKNRWTDKEGKIKYSYEYSLNKGLINEHEAIKKWKENMVSRCTYLPDKIALPKGSLLGEIFSIVNELNNFKCKDINENDYYLTREDKIKVFDELFLKKDSVTLDDVKDLLGLSSYYSEKGKTTKFNNKITVYRQIMNYVDELRIESIVDIFKDKDKLNRIEELIADINLFDEGKLKERYFAKKFNDDIAKKLAAIKVNGFYSISKDFIFETPMNEDGESMLDILFNDNVAGITNNQQVIISNACDQNGNKLDFLSNKYEKIIKENNNELSIELLLDNGKSTMPISRPVIRALNETLKVYNGYIKTYGVPSRVVIETAGGKDAIKDFTEQNGSTAKHYKKMEYLVNALFKGISEKDKNNAILGGKIEDWKDLEAFYNKNKNKVELYIRQDGIDLLTGEKIDLAKLDEYEIDHILPRGFGDDSQDDKMLTLKIANDKKGDRLPIEFLESPDAKGFTTMTVGRYTSIVNKLAEIKMISENKQNRLLLRDQQEAAGFINQNIVDTRYVISQFISMLKAFNKVNGYDTHVTCLNSTFTKLYAKALNIKKNRDFGDQHHALDAACLIIADKCLNEYFPNYDSQKSAHSKKGNYTGFGKYSEFINELNGIKQLNIDIKDASDDKKGELQQQRESSNQKINIFIRYAFKKAFGQNIINNEVEAPIIREIKERVPLISWKVEKNFDGKFFDATLGKPKQEGDKSVLSILGVNDDKRSFDSVNPVAVDFYKINHKNYAIHIPYVIVNSNGEINKEKYIKLIKEHYKADVLLNEDKTDINPKAFRFRAFKNDLIYDTQNNEIILFNLGSIANKKMEVKPLNILAYKDVYYYSNDIKQQVVKHFNIKSKDNENGTMFIELDKESVLEYLCDNLGVLNNPNKFKKRLFELTEKEDNLNAYCELIAYWSQIANNKLAWPTFDKQWKPTVQNDSLEKNPDAQYVKIKYNILGARFRNSSNGKLIVEGPRGYKNGGFKLIKKEEFHWTICKDMIE